MGLKFGLWFEPEMTNKDSDLFRAHPDWVLADIRRPYSHGRNQYVLDFSKEEVVDCVYRQMKKNPGRGAGFLCEVGHEPVFFGGVFQRKRPLLAGKSAA